MYVINILFTLYFVNISSFVFFCFFFFFWLPSIVSDIGVFFLVL